jgi:hypothetical protein
MLVVSPDIMRRMPFRHVSGPSKEALRNPGIIRIKFE